MATHDYIISNASGAAVRADLNNALAAIATNNSSATEPTTTYAYQWWADTGSSPTVMKLRNAANSGWITLFQLDGEWTVVPFENGTAAAPSIYFKDSGTDTGIYSPGTDQVGISAGGTSRFEVSTSATTSTLPVVHPLGAVGTPSITFTGDLNTGIWSPAADTVAVSTNGTRAITIDSSQRLGIGVTAPSFTNHIKQNTTYGFGLESNADDSRFLIGNISSTWRVAATYGSTGSFQPITFFTSDLERARLDASGRLLVGTSSSSLNTSLVLNGSSGGAGNPGILYFQRNEATPASGSSLGQIFFANNAGNAGALVTAERDGGTWTSGSSHPGKINFSTTSNGSGTPSLRWTIDSAGSLIGQSGSAFVASYIYNSTTATAANVNVDASGFLRRSTSSIKYKANVETIQDQYADAILGCRPVWYQSTCEADKPEWGHWGFIAEEVAEIDPRLCFFKEEEDGTLEPEGVQYDRFVPHLLNLIKRQKEQIEAMEARLTALESA